MPSTRALFRYAVIKFAVLQVPLLNSSDDRRRFSIQLMLAPVCLQGDFADISYSKIPVPSPPCAHLTGLKSVDVIGHRHSCWFSRSVAARVSIAAMTL
jgi:hypothetical protein